ncbi:MAG: MarR family winged helix-turn-helix transcriptional regulator [Parvularculaceae bacterium]
MTDKPFSLQEFMPYRFAVIADKMSRELARTYAEQYGISIAQWRVLSCLLSGAISGQPVTAKHVTDQTPMDKVKVSRAVANLLERKLISKKTDPSDGRAAILVLTTAGNKTATAIKDEALRFEQHLFAGWTLREVAQLKSLLDKF